MDIVNTINKLNRLQDVDEIKGLYLYQIYRSIYENPIVYDGVTYTSFPQLCGTVIFMDNHVAYLYISCYLTFELLEHITINTHLLERVKFWRMRAFTCFGQRFTPFSSKLGKITQLVKMKREDVVNIFDNNKDNVKKIMIVLDRINKEYVHNKNIGIIVHIVTSEARLHITKSVDEFSKCIEDVFNPKQKKSSSQKHQSDEDDEISKDGDNSTINIKKRNKQKSNGFPNSYFRLPILD